MEVSSILNASVSYQKTTSASVSVEASSSGAQVSASASVEETAAAYFEYTQAVQSVSYADKVSSLLADSNQRITEFKNLFARLLNRQAESFKLVENDKLWSKGKLEEMLKKATPEDVAAAQEAIADGGYFSVQSVTDRIMDMAQSLAEGDPSKIGILRNAVIAGFEQAGQIFGSELPEISQKTYESIMARFDEWEGAGEEAEVETEAD